MLTRPPLLTLAACIVLHASPLLAQTEVKWQAVAKITKGSCGDGAIAYVTERPGTAYFRLTYPNGTQYAEFDVALAADGSGKMQYTAGQNRNVVDLEISAGTGKRSLKTSGVTTKCDYVWTPK